MRITTKPQTLKVKKIKQSMISVYAWGITFFSLAVTRYLKRICAHETSRGIPQTQLAHLWHHSDQI